MSVFVGRKALVRENDFVQPVLFLVFRNFRTSLEFSAISEIFRSGPKERFVVSEYLGYRLLGALGLHRSVVRLVQLRKTLRKVEFGNEILYVFMFGPVFLQNLFFRGCFHEIRIFRDILKIVCEDLTDDVVHVIVEILGIVTHFKEHLVLLLGP